MTRIFRFERMLTIICLLAWVALSAITAGADPVPGPSDYSFYNVPSPLPQGDHGDLIWYRSVDLEIPDAVPVTAWQVLYRSTDARDQPNGVSGTVLVPNAPWAGSGMRPVISLAVGTQGPAQICAASFQLVAGTDYESANIAAGLKAGYAMLVSDYPGYTNGDIHPYMNGFANGHAILDIIKAARQIPGGPFRNNEPVGIWGYSQGGQTAAWAGQLQPNYMPGLNLKGVAAGGVPSDLLNVAENIDGKVGAGFLLQVYLGLYAQYPDEIPLYDLMNAEGLAAFENAKTMCMFEGLFTYMYAQTSEFTIGNRTLDDLMREYTEIRGRAESMTLGHMPIEAPVYLYHGTADAIIPLEQSLELRDNYCRMGVDTYYAVFESAEHVITMFQGASHAMAWFQDRFNGVPVSAEDICTNSPRPVANPNDPTGDFIITMDEWHLDSMVHLGRLDQDIYQPEESTYSADCNVSTKTVEGEIVVPTFHAPVKVLGIPLKAGFTLAPAGGMMGDLDITDQGILSIDGSTAFTFIIDGVGITKRAAIPFTLNTIEPVPMPLHFQGPVSDLGNGRITFEGETRVPRMEGGPFAPIFSAIMSGPLTYRYRVFPRDPWMY